MLKVLIADDEPYVRGGLRNIIPWNKLGFSLCEEGVDGDDAYEKICSLNPDLVLIDIRMPGKSGIDVIKDSIKNGFKGRFVIISGHSEFSYAKEAIKYGVKMYLLKPIDEDELLDIVLKIKEEILEEINFSNSSKFMVTIIKEHVLRNLCLNNKVKESEEIINSVKAESIAIALIYNTKNIINLEQCVREKILVNNVEVFKINDKVAIVFYDKNVDLILSILQQVKVQVEQQLKESIFIAVGTIVHNLIDIHQSYENADDLVNKRYVYLKEGIISESKIKEYAKYNELNEELILESIYKYIEIGEINKLISSLKQLENLFKCKRCDEEEIKVVLTNYYIKLKEKITNNYEVNKEFDIENKIIVEEIHNKRSLNEVIEFLIERFSFISRNIAIDLSNDGIKRVVKYVDHKYYTDLKLETLAELFNYNSSYLGKIFKDNTGKSFNTYLDTLRIERAKKLLEEDNLKVYQVCEKVGYKNIDYFYSKFKKYVGISPSNYKKTLELEEKKIIL